MCRCVSIIPGITMPPLASISSVPSGTSRWGPTAAIVSPVTRTSAAARTVCASSMVSTVPPRRTTGWPFANSSGFAIETSGYVHADERPLHDRMSGLVLLSAIPVWYVKVCHLLLTLSGSTSALGWTHCPYSGQSSDERTTADDGGPGTAGRAAGGGLLPDPGRAVFHHAAGRHGSRGGQGRGPRRGRHPELAASGQGRRLHLLPGCKPQQALGQDGTQG